MKPEATVSNKKRLLYLLYAVFVSERMQCKSRDLENPSTVHVTISTGQVTVRLERGLVQVNHSLEVTLMKITDSTAN